jgi:hypothetical protein
LDRRKLVGRQTRLLLLLNASLLTLILVRRSLVQRLQLLGTHGIILLPRLLSPISHRTLLRLRPLPHKLGLLEIFMIIPRHNVRVRSIQCLQPFLSILIPLPSRFLIPLPRSVKPAIWRSTHTCSSRRTNPNFGIIPQCEFSRCKSLPCCFIRKRPSKNFILLERAFGTAQEPFGERHISFGFPLLRRQRIILDAQ